jgi:hypothetical protein
MQYGMSVTDACMDWTQTTDVLAALSRAIRTRRTLPAFKDAACVGAPVHWPMSVAAATCCRCCRRRCRCCCCCSVGPVHARCICTRCCRRAQSLCAPAASYGWHSRRGCLPGRAGHCCVHACVICSCHETMLCRPVIRSPLAQPIASTSPSTSFGLDGYHLRVISSIQIEIRTCLRFPCVFESWYA